MITPGNMRFRPAETDGELRRQLAALLRQRAFNNALVTIMDCVRATGRNPAQLTPHLAAIAERTESRTYGKGGGLRRGWRIRMEFRNSDAGIDEARPPC